MNFGRRIGSALAVLWFSIVASAASAQPVVQAAWSQVMGQTEQAETGDLAPLNIRMRFVLGADSNLSCKDFTISLKGKTVLLTKWSTRTVFDIAGTTVCDAPMSENWTEAGLVLSDGTPARVSLVTPEGVTELRKVTFAGPTAIGRRQLAQNRGDALEVAVLGNTGCIGEIGSQSKQDCTDDAAWPFARIAAHIGRATMLPDFVLHLGNTRYDSPDDQSWERWYSEFFAPAQALLLDVPWAFTRGSEEECGSQSAGIGWLLFFGPVSEVEDLEICNRGQSIVPVHFFDVAVKSTSDATLPHRFILVDSGPNPDRNLSKNFAKSLTLGQAGWNSETPSATIVTHRPIWGLDTFSGMMQQQSDPQVLAAFERAVQGLEDGPCKPFSSKECGVKKVLSSHQQAFENIVFPSETGDLEKWDLPTQIVVGNSGAKLQKPEPNTAFTFENASMSGRGGGQNCGKVANWSNDFGYLVLRRSAETISQTQSGWASELRFLKETETAIEFDKMAIDNGFSEDVLKAKCEW